MPSLDHCDLQAAKHMGVNNLPEVVTQVANPIDEKMFPPK